MNWLLLFGLITSITDALKDLGTDSTCCSDAPTSCEDLKYRSYDGSCNNLNHSCWGTSYSAYKRILPNSYSDGVHAFPMSKSNKSLPNPRTCSLRTYVDIPNPDKLWTLVFMQYAQIISHDMSLTAGVLTRKSPIACCSGGQVTSEGKCNPRCAPILLPENDPYNSPEGIKCMNFNRVETTKDGRQCTGTTEVAEPLTAVTAFLDASFTYGSDKKTAKKLRGFKGGQLAFVTRKGRELMPQDPDPTTACNIKKDGEPCYFSGDMRVNQNPQLALLQNIYLAQHNSIAKDLAEVNPHWDDETLFEETRRIVIAQHQHIIYYEFLPPLIGRQNMVDNKLIYPDADGFIEDYDKDVNPGISNEFAAAAFRFYHTEIVGSIQSYKENRNVSNQIELYQWINRPSVCEHANNFNGLTIGLATQPQGAVDRFMPKDILNLLFIDGLLGRDLKTFDIQRGRDQGVGTYAQALKAFGLSDPKCFQDFEQFIKPEYVNILMDLYESYEDVDLTVGLSLETILPESLSGPTVRAILTEQFKRTRVADHCFYENGNGKCSFTIDQLTEIRKSSSIAGFLCYNPGVKQMQAEAFKQVSKKNPLKFCSDIPRLNPEAWKEIKQK